MPGQLWLIFGTYNILPLGIPEKLQEERYQHFIKPFLSTLYLYPEVRTVLYYSGVLLQWLERKHPEFLDVLEEMISRKQVELLGGAYYDPILTILPRSDALGQIEQMTTYIRKKFGKRPRGLFLPELEWEPWLPSTLRTCGMEYTFLGEFHFNATGVTNRYLPYLTEDQGKAILVFPLFEDLSPMFHGVAPQQVLQAFLAHHSTEEDRVITLLLPAESFNPAWENIYKEIRNSSRIQLTQPTRYLRQGPIGDKTYFPCGSNEERMVHALPKDRAQKYLELKEKLGAKQKYFLFGAGFFRQFLTRFSECNLLYAKMQYVHLLVNGIKGDKYRKNSAKEELWKGQFGKAYSSAHLEGGYTFIATAYRSLITAERITREKGVFIPSVVVLDFDLDGREEFLYQGQEINAYIHVRGGRIFELDTLKRPWNYFKVPQGGFFDYIFSNSAKSENFIDTPYRVVKCDKERSELVLEQKGTIIQKKEEIGIRIVKKFIFKGSTINLYYSISNNSGIPVSFTFGVGLSLSFPDLHSVQISAAEGREGKKILGELVIEDKGNNTYLSFSTLEPVRGWNALKSNLSPSLQLEGLCREESFIPYWEIALEQGATWENRITWKVDFV
ncbi:MAG: hypothetical protein SNJ78_10635 [Spirochaetales bacterium]